MPKSIRGWRRMTGITRRWSKEILKRLEKTERYLRMSKLSWISKSSSLGVLSIIEKSSIEALWPVSFIMTDYKIKNCCKSFLSISERKSKRFERLESRVNKFWFACLPMTEYAMCGCCIHRFAQDGPWYNPYSWHTSGESNSKEYRKIQWIKLELQKEDCFVVL